MPATPAKAKKAAPGITREGVIATTIALLHEEGPEGLSMRKLATRLGISAPTLYWHFPDKAALMAAVMEHLFSSCLTRIGACNSATEWLRAFGRAIWQVQCETPHVPLLILSTEQSADGYDRMQAALRGGLAPFARDAADMERLMQLQAAVQSLVTGWTTLTQGKGRRLSAQYDVEAVAMRSLDALIAGWPQG
ncbi:TetR family transcriptional regulator [Novosphingobium sp. FSY-8]|uniref:TetR family transcriptional regulator n=1 Tax=Novosphingobium ovatum TaxID=1908523 RepID=A0ABW9XA78_9SPHN|nr:TetR/AcrR family transcriptional regulator [Novosphingobium ovatum]NBC35428.1 TetR family transcriptional regulator [Novosphingobium ovatum]